MIVTTIDEERGVITYDWRDDYEYTCRGCGYAMSILGGAHDGTETCPRCQESGTTASRPTLDDYDRFDR